jgi:hypothetical protein
MSIQANFQATLNTRKTNYVPVHYRRILCIFPKYSRSFGTFHHAYPLIGDVRAFMPPQGILLVARSSSLSSQNSQFEYANS